MAIRRIVPVVWVIGALALPAGVTAAGEYGKSGEQKQTSEYYKEKGGHAGKYVLSADQIEGMTLKSRDGKDVGSIHRVLVNTQTGHIDYVVVSSGGVLGVGDRKYVVPWQAFEVRRTGERWEGFVAKVDADKLKTAPEYRADMTDDYRYSIWNWWGVRSEERRG
jgi:sporulation protein YlmC with PRC-barrel domain